MDEGPIGADQGAGERIAELRDHPAAQQSNAERRRPAAPSPSSPFPMAPACFWLCAVGP
jgi:hypothetical protein